MKLRTIFKFGFKNNSQIELRFREFGRTFCRKIVEPPEIATKSDKNGDLIGPPHPVSNLRPIVFHKPSTESKLETKYRETRAATQLWNQNFWTQHNSSFVAERKGFQEKLKSQGKETLTADEMSVFYKKFLDKNWWNHYNYNVEWYKRNIFILFLEIRVRLKKLKFK